MIDNFRGKYRFLSNFYETEIMFCGSEYPSVEHAYQACKTRSKKEREEIRLATTPGKAKKLGQFCTIRENWDDIKVSVMRLLIDIKFDDPVLSQLLLDTGDEELIEGNTWGDTFWGVCDGKGKNMLGKILMGKRNELNLFKGYESQNKFIESVLKGRSHD